METGERDLEKELRWEIGKESEQRREKIIKKKWKERKKGKKEKEKKKKRVAGELNIFLLYLNDTISHLINFCLPCK